MLDLAAKPSLGPSLEQIVALYRERLGAMGNEIARMSRLRDNYNGDVVIPLPEMDRSEESSVANIIANGLDQTAMRIASTLPSIYYPPLRDGIKDSTDKARTRRLANQGWWDVNDMGLKLRLRSRKLIGYAASPVSLRPDLKNGCAKWQLRDPLTCFPSTPDDATDMTPENCIFSYQRTRSWIKVNYPEQLTLLSIKKVARNRFDSSGEDATESPDDKFTILEYQDSEVTVLCILAMDSNFPNQMGLPFIELERTRNRTGMTLVVTPGRLNLDKPRGAYDDLVGMNLAMAKLQAFELIFAGKSVFPDRYLVSRANEQARFSSGPHPSSSGMVNIVEGGQVENSVMSTGYSGTQMIDRLERNMRVTGGIAAEMGGESQTNVRTGKRGDSIMSAVIDFPVQEAQEILETSLEHENRRAVAIAKTYFGNEKKSFYITSGPNTKTVVDYVAKEVFENDNNIVSYPQSGADANGLVTGGGQRVAMGTLSKRSFMELDPTISDPEREWEMIEQEQIQSAILAGFTQQLTAGAVPIADGARVFQLIATTKVSLQDAIVQVHNEAQARQATPAPQGAPATMPGLAQPGAGAEQPAIPQGAPSQANLAQILGQLKTTSAGA